MCWKAKRSHDEVEAANKSENIDKQLKADGKATQTSMKILLLGTGDAGKSTFCKQLSMEYSSNSSLQAEIYIPILQENVLGAMKDLLRYAQENKVHVSRLDTDGEKVLSATELSPEIADLIAKFSESKHLQKILNEQGEALQLQGGINGVKYYFTHVKRFAEKNFVPTKDDILHARRKTTGILETVFQYKGTEFTLVDVGGQRSERKKWLHCFGSVTAVIFLCALNEYDMILEEDAKTNRLVESLKLWKALTSSQFFKLTPFILFLNKSDLFQEKIKKLPLSEVFQDYDSVIQTLEKKGEGMSDFEKGWRYICKQFNQHFSGSEFYPFVTCAIDTDNCKKVFDAVQDTLVKKCINQNTTGF